MCWPILNISSTGKIEKKGFYNSLLQYFDMNNFLYDGSSYG